MLNLLLTTDKVETNFVRVNQSKLSPEITNL